MEELGSGAGKMLPRTAAGMSLRQTEQSLGVLDMKSATSGSGTAEKNQGAWGQKASVWALSWL